MIEVAFSVPHSARVPRAQILLHCGDCSALHCLILQIMSRFNSAADMEVKRRRPGQWKFTIWLAKIRGNIPIFYFLFFFRFPGSRDDSEIHRNDS